MKLEYSVLMSVYFKEDPDFFRGAMNSIWTQTVPTSDFVLVCDGPLTPKLDSVIVEMEKEHRGILHVVRLKDNGGLGVAMNEGLKHCINDLVARMDSDDISLPDRCERQLASFADQPDLSICSGTVEEFFDEPNVIAGRRTVPTTQQEIIQFSRKRNPFNHPTAMFKKSAVQAVGGYNEEYHLFEDYYLWIRMLKKGYVGYNLQEPLLKMRMSSDTYRRRGGMAYAKELLRFHHWMCSIGWTNWITYLNGAIPHAIVCVAPNRMRKAIYRMMRKKTYKEKRR